MNKDTELKPCEFCKSKAIEDSAGIHCSNKKCPINLLTKCTSYEVWNQRSNADSARLDWVLKERAYVRSASPHHMQVRKHGSEWYAAYECSTEREAIDAAMHQSDLPNPEESSDG